MGFFIGSSSPPRSEDQVYYPRRLMTVSVSR
jgi:hypothetical protein